MSSQAGPVGPNEPGFASWGDYVLENVLGEAATLRSGRKPIADTTNQLIRSVFMAVNKHTHTHTKAVPPQINTQLIKQIAHLK